MASAFKRAASFGRRRSPPRETYLATYKPFSPPKAQWFKASDPDDAMLTVADVWPNARCKQRAESTLQQLSELAELRAENDALRADALAAKEAEARAAEERDARDADTAEELAAAWDAAMQEEVASRDATISELRREADARVLELDEARASLVALEAAHAKLLAARAATASPGSAASPSPAKSPSRHVRRQARRSRSSLHAEPSSPCSPGRARLAAQPVAPRSPQPRAEGAEGGAAASQRKWLSSQCEDGTSSPAAGTLPSSYESGATARKWPVAAGVA